MTAISQTVQSLNDLRALTVEEQSCLLLQRLVGIQGRTAERGFHRGNLRLPNLMFLGDGFPENERRAVTDVFLAAPWQKLVSEGFISEGSQNFFYLTPEGRQAAVDCQKSAKRPVRRMALGALALLHPDFRSYGHYFKEDRLKEAVAAAFERYENRLNEIRDRATTQGAKSAVGQNLVYFLFREGILRFPYPELGGQNKPDLEKSLQGLMSGALGGSETRSRTKSITFPRWTRSRRWNCFSSRAT
jgi:hypothetical protein